MTGYAIIYLILTVIGFLYMLLFESIGEAIASLAIWAIFIFPLLYFGGFFSPPC